MPDELKIISIDPGVTTGYTYGLLVPGERLDVHPFQAIDEVDGLWDRLAELKPHHIIIERFDFRQGKQRSGINLFPRELIGVTKLYSLKAPPPCSLYLQSAAQGKSYFSDTTLKNNGLYVRGKGHAMDSLRHLLQWITFGAGYQFNGSDKGRTKFTHLSPTWPPLHKIVKKS